MNKEAWRGKDPPIIFAVKLVEFLHDGVASFINMASQ
jgi:hypothetical protein